MRKTSIQVVKEPVCSRSEEAKSKSQGGIMEESSDSPAGEDF